MLKIGMVGVGAISGIYLENLTKTFKEIELVAVCDLIKERALNAKEKYNIPKIYDTMYELFEDEEIDIVPCKFNGIEGVNLVLIEKKLR